ncbi:hypothetical protein [Halalkalibacter sp. APA_J-10(15)]|uniref:hypothetical protein n=1 Tax=Halalkalibacter sp. APA_J-10(15) TaxID=2933805 RepID=UPI001FF61D9D|nr:hypothetical protein [Halalkalibacter sp. APA_J-10(15)]MCK0472084.1 hypothetical protein [Halalkalibacter sp. APA_J-10(15)]
MFQKLHHPLAKQYQAEKHHIALICREGRKWEMAYPISFKQPQLPSHFTNNNH